MDGDPRPRAAILAPESPYPLMGGGAIRTASVLHGLARSYELDLIVFRQPGDPDPRAAIPPGLVSRICVINLPPHGRGTSVRFWRSATRVIRHVPPLVDRFAGFERQIAAAVEGRQYNLAIIEHFWCAPYWEQLSPVSPRIVLDLHNLESVLHARCSRTEAAAPALAHRIFASAALEMERRWLPRFSRILTASSEDRRLVLERAASAEVTVYPNAVPLPPLPRVARRHAIVFSGNLEYHPNRSAVRFFRHEVWPRLRQRWPELVWRLVGRNPSAVQPWTRGDPRIEVTGPVDDAIVELAAAEVAIVPLLAGSGTRFKILEAWAAGVPVVSTTLGAEGLPAHDGRHLLIADGATAFTDAISRLLQDSALRSQLAHSGRALLECAFTWEKAWQRLDL